MNKFKFGTMRKIGLLFSWGSTVPELDCGETVKLWRIFGKLSGPLKDQMFI